MYSDRNIPVPGGFGIDGRVLSDQSGKRMDTCYEKQMFAFFGKLCYTEKNKCGGERKCLGRQINQS